jgi:hypothetical protein
MRVTKLGRAIVVLTTVLCLGACDTPPERAAGRASPTPTGDQASDEPAARPPTSPPSLRVYIDTKGVARKRVARAVRDLKMISMWRRLTDRLFILRIETMTGEKGEVPEDGHLADAGLAVHVDPTGAGWYCYIRIWPSALERDLANQRTYYAEGRLGFEPPTERVFWASILGHELGHCQGRRQVTPEDVALEWENRVRDVLSRRI